MFWNWLHSVFSAHCTVWGRPTKGKGELCYTWNITFKKYSKVQNSCNIVTDVHCVVKLKLIDMPRPFPWSFYRTPLASCLVSYFSLSGPAGCCSEPCWDFDVKGNFGETHHHNSWTLLAHCTCTVHTTKSVHFDKIILKEKRTFIMKGPKSLSLKMKAPFFSSLGWSPIQNLFHLFCGRLTNRIQARSPRVRTLTVLQGHFFQRVFTFLVQFFISAQFIFFKPVCLFVL